MKKIQILNFSETMVCLLFTQTIRVEILCINNKTIKFYVMWEWPTTKYVQISWTDKKERKNCIASNHSPYFPKLSKRSLYTDVVLFFFSFLSEISASARERKKFQLIPSILFFPHLYPLRWRSTNPPRFLFLSRALDGLWRGTRGSLNRLFQTKWREHLIL